MNAYMMEPGIYFSRLVHPYMMQIRLCSSIEFGQKKGRKINPA